MCNGPALAGIWLVLLGFCCGLMAKPMIVTLPFVLLLLDVWPLRRANRLAILWEKLPFFGLAAAVSLVTYIAQRQGHAIQSFGSLPAGLRIANALVTYIVYIARMFWPAKLAVFYPYSHQLPAWRAVAAGIALAGITFLALRRFRPYPYLAVGWFWYLGTLVPVIGLVQVGGQSSADRYTYLPTVGLAIMLSWGTADLLKRYPRARTVVVVSAVAACSACVVVTSIQLRYWADTESLFRHAVSVTTDNYIAHNNLADYYLSKLRNDEARSHVIEALRVQPNYAEAHVNLATILRRAGQTDEAEKEYRVALSSSTAQYRGAFRVWSAFVQPGTRQRSAARVLGGGPTETGVCRRALCPGEDAGLIGTNGPGDGRVLRGDPASARRGRRAPQPGSRAAGPRTIERSTRRVQRRGAA